MTGLCQLLSGSQKEFFGFLCVCVCVCVCVYIYLAAAFTAETQPHEQ